MLEYYCRCRERRAVWERNVLAPFMKEAACRLRKDGYKYKGAQADLRYMVCFGDWLKANEVAVEQARQEHGRKFVDELIQQGPGKCAWRKLPARAAVHRVLSLIHEKYPRVVMRSPAEVEVDRYAEHLRRNRGLAEGTIANHRRCLEGFLRACFAQEEVSLSEITAARIHAYVEAIPRTAYNSRQGRACTTLRGYFRFRRLQGTAIHRLDAAVPLIATPRAALSPKSLTVAEAQRFLGAIDRSRPTGKRDYAAALCMTELGMRVGDVARLSLNDIDWREGTVRVANHKRARPYRLPLPNRLGRALADYLTHGRPPSERREIFLRHARPFGAPATAVSLKLAVRSIWRRAGMQECFSGTHILRHSIATRMKQKGVALKSIADVLGHHSLQTTTLYAQVDLPALRQAAQSWPEGQS